MGELQHLKVDEQPYFNDTKHSLFSLLFDIENDYGSIIDTCEPSDDFNQSDIRETQKDILTVVEEPPYLDVLEDKFDQLETYDERLQVTDIELPCLNKPPEVGDDENTEESGPLYPVAQGMDFKCWKELDE